MDTSELGSRVDQHDEQCLHCAIQLRAEARRLESSSHDDGVRDGEQRRAFRHPPVIARVAIHLARVARAAQCEDVPVGVAFDRLS